MLELRVATENDLQAVLEIERQSYPFPWSLEAFQNELVKPFSNVLVLVDEQQVAGYIVYWLLFDEAHILNVTVSPTHRGAGFGARLVRRVINDAMAKEMKRVFLEVRTSNAAAIALYQKLGFFTDHVKKSFYEDGEDAYFMVRYLQRS